MLSTNYFPHIFPRKQFFIDPESAVAMLIFIGANQPSVNAKTMPFVPCNEVMSTFYFMVLRVLKKC